LVNIRKGQNIMMKKGTNIRRVVQTGLLIALALVIRSFSFMVFFGGAAGMRISFSGVFTRLAAVLFGPLYGGIASGLLDILGYIMKPEGGYIPWMTVTAVLGGVLTGLVWLIFKDIDPRKLQKAFLVFFIAIGIIGLANHINVILLSQSSWAKAIISIGKNRNFATIGLEVVSIVGIVIFIIDRFIQRKQQRLTIHENYLKLLIATGVAGLVVTVLNTFILQAFIPALGKIGFFVFLIPRVIQDLLMTVVTSYVISYLLAVYKRLTRD
jgi:ECF transporter S component (folate family)